MSSNLIVHGADTYVPPGPHVLSTPGTARTTKSMLKNLFTWKKTSPTQDNTTITSTADISDSRPQTSDSKQEQPTIARKPSFSDRSRSDITTPQRSKTRSKSRRRSRSRCRAVWDPPPLFQAYNQAFMHDTLQIPNKGFLDWLPRNTSSRSSAKNSDGAEEERDETYAPSITHRRSMSDSSTSSLSKRLFFLLENGHILQYKAEGSQDRLPERVLELSRDSVAFASDAIAGQHWVLEICPYGRAENEPKTTSPRMPWSRMTFKAADTKRLAEKLLLVFDSADTLFTWLIAIRKQIEGMGGIEYQPDAPPLPQPDARRPLLRNASSEYFKRKNGILFSRSSSALPLKLDDHKAHEKELPQLPAGLSYKRSVSIRSTAASSVATKTSLERLRESYSGSSTAGTALSSDVSAASLSPTLETFPPMLTSVLVRDLKHRAVIDRAVPKTPTSPLYKSEKRSPSPETSHMDQDDVLPLAFEKQASEQIEQFDGEGDASPKAIPQLVATHDMVIQPKLQAPSILAPVPVLELRKRLKQAHRNLSASNLHTKSEVDAVEPADHHIVKNSFSTSLKGHYGLFPRKPPLDVRASPLVLLDQSSGLGLSDTQTTDHMDASGSHMEPVALKFGANLFARSNTTFKRPAPIALPSLLAPMDLDQPMRSPAVTDAMLDSNFGTIPIGSAPSPATPVEIRMPDFGGIKVDKSLIESVRAIEVRETSPSHSPNARKVLPRRSMPNFHYGSANMVSAPVGPPPSGPLPAVPPIGDGRASRNSIPSKRASTQSSGTRRMSTKSAVSVKKARSPAPSFSLPTSQSRASLPSNTRLPATMDADNDVPIWTTLPPPIPKERAFTIGQVSVVSAPLRTSSISQHKKSHSTSSTMSNRSRQHHVRTPSNKSLCGSPNNLPSISHLLPPSCGSGPDFGYNERGCFGISASRSST